MIKQLGAVPEPVEVTYNNPKVAISNQEFSAKVATWDAVDASLKTFAHMAVAAQGWLQLVPRRQLLPGAEPQPGPSQGEPGAALAGIRCVHAAGAGRDGVRRGHDQHADDRHRRVVGGPAGAARPAALVELTVFIGFANLASRVNTAHGITSQGCSDACEIPLAKRPEKSGVASTA
jgi:hypothetical protein